MGDQKYQHYLREIEREEARSDLVFTCQTCGLRMPWLPRPGGKKRCPRCGDPLSVVKTVYVSMSESVKLAEELDRLLKEYVSCSSISDERLRAPAAKCGSKLTRKGDV